MSKKLSVGAALTTIGAVGIILSIVLGWTDVGRPWSFLIGFGFGVSAGIGVPLCLAGLWARRNRAA